MFHPTVFGKNGISGGFMQTYIGKRRWDWSIWHASGLLVDGGSSMTRKEAIQEIEDTIKDIDEKGYKDYYYDEKPGGFRLTFTGPTSNDIQYNTFQ